MSELKAELIKIVVDKGLFGLIVIAVGFYIQRSLERYRSKGIYYQKLAEQKLAVLKDISYIFGKQLFLIHGFLNAVEESNTNTPESEAHSIERVMQTYNEFTAFYRQKMPEVLANTIFLSSELAERLVTHQDGVVYFTNVIDRHRREGEPSMEGLVAPTKTLEESFAELQHVIANELRIPPVI